jgi:hypothetical protein
MKERFWDEKEKWKRIARFITTSGGSHLGLRTVGLDDRRERAVKTDSFLQETKNSAVMPVTDAATQIQNK